ncbi:hypothetical protein [Novosphingobium mangrovi (ex Huang et al. 2023)]|uniref:Uncharacterized protein n=1 Tax=Novosphingobium mangrovi (ex Huang et al. 2023) TaxID=2976432 RepID=A0ABT2I4U4_9SPHN|nr:hypothetical protein [Novosphingobium mangrovi (ex Huang et al. 2023)]MCT2399839.1 hypothetical protein [Novosphingobium mangrovi (ex Huang et al. 2023)]
MLAIFGVAASILGFVLAASTFLVGHVQDKRFDLLRKSKSWQEFPRLVKSSIWWSFTLTVVSGIFSLLRYDVFIFISPIYVFVVCNTLISLGALIWVVIAILSIVE